MHNQSVPGCAPPSIISRRLSRPAFAWSLTVLRIYSSTVAPLVQLSTHLHAGHESTFTLLFARLVKHNSESTWDWHVRVTNIASCRQMPGSQLISLTDLVSSTKQS